MFLYTLIYAQKWFNSYVFGYPHLTFASNHRKKFFLLDFSLSSDTNGGLTPCDNPITLYPISSIWIFFRYLFYSKNIFWDSIWIYRMTRCVYLYIWRHETIVTYGHLCNIKDCTVIICKEVLAHFYMWTVIAVKWWVNTSSIRLAKQLLYNLWYAVEIRAFHEV